MLLYIFYAPMGKFFFFILFIFDWKFFYIIHTFFPPYYKPPFYFWKHKISISSFLLFIYWERYFQLSSGSSSKEQKKGKFLHFAFPFFFLSYVQFSISNHKSFKIGRIEIYVHSHTNTYSLSFFHIDFQLFPNQHFISLFFLLTNNNNNNIRNNIRKKKKYTLKIYMSVHWYVVADKTTLLHPHWFFLLSFLLYFFFFHIILSSNINH